MIRRAHPVLLAALLSPSVVAAQEVSVAECGLLPLAAGTMDGPVSYNQAFVDEMIQEHALNQAQWSNGWGWSSPLNDSLPFGRLMNALRVINDAERAGTPQDNFVVWADEYIDEQGDEIKPLCGSVRGRKVSWPRENNAIKIGTGGFNDNLWRRAATVIHEVRHGEGFGHDLKDAVDCAAGASTPTNPCCTNGGKTSPTDNAGSCDRSFYDWGANSLHVAWMIESIANNRFVTNTAQEDALITRANTTLTGRFAQDPGFRVVTAGPRRGQLRPQGSTFQYLQTKAGDDWVTPTVNNLGSTLSTACFLTRMTGMFRDGDYGFEIRSDGAATDPQWLLESRTASPEGPESGIGVGGRCIPISSAASTYEFDLGFAGGFLFKGRDEDLNEPVDSRVCFLTGVGGTLQNSLEGVWLDMDGGTAENPTWMLHMKTAAESGSEPRRPLFASVQCIDGTLASGPTETSENNTISLVGSDAGATGSLDTFCALSGVTGKFEGQDEVAQILGVPRGPIPTSFFPVDWLLQTTENRHDGATVYGHAVCFQPS